MTSATARLIGLCRTNWRSRLFPSLLRLRWGGGTTTCPVAPVLRTGLLLHGHGLHLPARPRISARSSGSAKKSHRAGRRENTYYVNAKEMRSDATTNGERRRIQSTYYVRPSKPGRMLSGRTPPARCKSIHVDGDLALCGCRALPLAADIKIDGVILRPGWTVRPGGEAEGADLPCT